MTHLPVVHAGRAFDGACQLPGSLAVSAGAIRAGLGPSAHGPFAETTAFLHDSHIRLALLEALAQDYVDISQSSIASGRDLIFGGAVIAEEVPLPPGHVRADVVVARPDAFHIYEIKSDHDRLDRFAEQARIYGELADSVTLVVGWRYASWALREAPPWWEIWLAERAGEGGVALVPLRNSRPNPCANWEALSALLDQSSMLTLLQMSDCDSSDRAPDLVSRPRARAAPWPDQVRAAVHQQLSRRDRGAVRRRFLGGD